MMMRCPTLGISVSVVSVKRKSCVAALIFGLCTFVRVKGQPLQFMRKDSTLMMVE
jgi:hypothetical protein